MVRFGILHFVQDNHRILMMVRVFTETPWLSFTVCFICFGTYLYLCPRLF